MEKNQSLAARASAMLLHWAETEGMARLTLMLLLLTTVGCLSYTWGYAEVRLLLGVIHA